MKITVNDEKITLDTPTSVENLLTQLGRHQQGTALALNQTVLPREHWATQQLAEGDDVVVFQAIAGG